MKLTIICDKSYDLIKLKSKLKKEFFKERWNKDYKIKIIPKEENNADVYLIMSNDLEYVYRNSYELQEKNNVIIIITSNLKAANIMGCLNITPYVYYTKNKTENIAYKIVKAYDNERIYE